MGNAKGFAQFAQASVFAVISPNIRRYILNTAVVIKIPLHCGAFTDKIKTSCKFRNAKKSCMLLCEAVKKTENSALHIVN